MENLTSHLNNRPKVTDQFLTGQFLTGRLVSPLPGTLSAPLRFTIRYSVNIALIQAHTSTASTQIESSKTKAPVKRSKLFTQQHTTFVYHLLHVVACCCLGQWSNASNILCNFVQLYNLSWIVRLKYNCSPRNH